MEFESLLTLMREKGIVGAGGAGFPSYAKLNKNVDTLIINCAECEPYLTSDYRKMLEEPDIMEMVRERAIFKIREKDISTRHGSSKRC